jgi:hypothetical protein
MPNSNPFSKNQLVKPEEGRKRKSSDKVRISNNIIRWENSQTTENSKKWVKKRTLLCLQLKVLLIQMFKEGTEVSPEKVIQFMGLNTTSKRIRVSYRCLSIVFLILNQPQQNPF